MHNNLNASIQDQELEILEHETKDGAFDADLLLDDFEIEYAEFDCGKACTPNGCMGHSTDIPISFTTGGVTFHVKGAESGDFPDNDDNVKLAIHVVNKIKKLILHNNAKNAS